MGELTQAAAFNLNSRRDVALGKIDLCRRALLTLLGEGVGRAFERLRRRVAKILVVVVVLVVNLPCALTRVLERDGAKVGLDGPSVIAVAGKKKAFRTVLSQQDYAEVRRLGDEFRSRTPRSVEK